MKNYLILFSIFLLIGCGGDSSITNSYSNNKIEIKTTHTVLDPSEKKFYLEFIVKNKYPDDVSFKLSDISLDFNNTCAISKTIVNKDYFEFNRTKQYNLIGITVDFYSPCKPSIYRVKAINDLTYKDSTNRKTYLSEYIPIKIDSNLTINTDFIFDYDVILKAVSGSSKIGLNTTKRYKLYSNNKDGNFINVNSVTIKSIDTSKVKLIRPDNYGTNSEEENKSLTFKNINDVNFYIRTYNKSGLATLNVNINYTDNNNTNHNVNKTTYLTIFSGEPTAFSINSIGTAKYNQDTGWFKQKFLISASDKYGNTINNPTKIDISVMADFNKDNNGRKILYGEHKDINNNLIRENDNTHFIANIDNFNNINPNIDFLLLFGDVDKSEVLGKWDITSSSDNTLTLEDDYNGATTKKYHNLGFAIGHNYIKDICSSDSKEWEIKIDSTNDREYQLDKNGETNVTLKFPPYLIGKTIALSVNFLGEKRAGEVHFETLKTKIKVPKPIEIDINTTKNIVKTRFFQIDTGTEDIIYVRNSKVNCTYNSSANVQILNIDKKNNDSSNCKDDSGITSWTITAELLEADANKTGSIKFNECHISSKLDF